MSDDFERFLASADGRYVDFINDMDAYLTKSDCKRSVKLQKSGYLVSYDVPGERRTLCTFVPRKSGMRLRIYARNVGAYQAFLDTLPAGMQKEIEKASVCKRLINAGVCNPKCAMGYTFEMGGSAHQKCRHMAFMPLLSAENNPYIRDFLAQELACCAR